MRMYTPRSTLSTLSTPFAGAREEAGGQVRQDQADQCSPKVRPERKTSSPAAGKFLQFLQCPTGRFSCRPHCIFRLRAGAIARWIGNTALSGLLLLLLLFGGRGDPQAASVVEIPPSPMRVDHSRRLDTSKGRGKWGAGSGDVLIENLAVGSPGHGCLLAAAIALGGPVTPATNRQSARKLGGGG